MVRRLKAEATVGMPTTAERLRWGLPITADRYFNPHLPHRIATSGTFKSKQRWILRLVLFVLGVVSFNHSEGSNT